MDLALIKDVTEVVGVVLNSIIYLTNVIQKDKNNKKLYSSISKRLNSLQSLVGKIQKTEGYEQSDEVCGALKNLQTVLESAEREVQKYNDAKKLKRVVNSSSYKEKVDNLNQRLTEAFETLSGALHVFTLTQAQEEKKRAQEEKIQAQREQEKKLAQEEKKRAQREQEKKLAQEAQREKCIIL